MDGEQHTTDSSNAETAERLRMPEPDDESLWKPEDVARYLQVPVSWVYEGTRARGRRKIPHIKVGRYPRFEREVIMQLKDQLRRGYPRTAYANKSSFY
jgi:hypothetical protein